MSLLSNVAFPQGASIATNRNPVGFLLHLPERFFEISASKRLFAAVLFDSHPVL